MALRGAVLGIVVALLGCSEAERSPRPASEQPVDAASPISTSEGGATREAAIQAEPEAATPTPEWPVDAADEIPRGSPSEHVQVLYNRGNAPASQVRSIHVDADGVYWWQGQNSLVQGTRDGSGPAQQVAQWQRGSGARPNIQSDDEHLYWLDKLEIYRRPKAGGEAEAISLEIEANAFAVTDRHLYAAAWGCPVVMRIDKQTLAIESQSIVLNNPGSGPTTVFEDDGEVFCSAWSSVYVIRQWGQEAERLTDVADRIEGAVVTGSYVYWIDTHGGGGLATIGRVPRSGGRAEAFDYADTFFSLGSTRLVRGASEDALWFSDGRYLVSFDTQEHRYSVRAFDAPLDLTISGDHIYWTAQYLVYEIRRMPLDAPPLYHLR